MRYGSVCSGIEAATMAWHPLGWEPEFFSEIEKFPSAVLAHHYPHVPNLGDMSKFKEWTNVRPIDLLVGGTPCQSFSVAGLRKGLDDPRGNLMLTYLALAGKFRPEWIVWENVPGVLSSNEGRDFGTFLTGLGQLGYGFAFRVLDAQYVRVDGLGRAVPQRRRRVFVVGYLGDWRRAAAVLFDAESLRGNTPPCRKTGQGVTHTIKGGSGSRGWDNSAEASDSLIVSHDPASTIQTTCDDYSRSDGFNMIAHTLLAKSNDSHAADLDTYVAHTLRGEGHDASEDGTGRGVPIISFQGNASGANFNADEDITGTLRSGHSNHPAVAFDGGIHTTGHQGDRAYGPDGAWGTLAAQGGNNGGGAGGILVAPWVVRRLTPRECERLQGFPDDFTQIPWRKKDAENCPDGPRYKALGNSMAVNVMRWIGRRIEWVESEFPK